MHEGWLRKKQLAENITNSDIDDLYDMAVKAGAWGGKILGAGGGGCLMLLAPQSKHDDIKAKLNLHVNNINREGFREIPVRFSEAGAGVLFNNEYKKKFT